jgi:NAD(P)-dependent dehydrogenase (short-subunit alcohol dehydrogenase family)
VNTVNSPSVKITITECDQSSLASVKSASEEFLKLVDRLDIFIANAGIMGGDSDVSKDGHEIQFAVNYLSRALFIELLPPMLERTASMNTSVRIVFYHLSVSDTHPPVESSSTI